jgi:DNA polymerase (family 10)
MLPAAEKIRARLARLPEVRQISLAGSLRRMKETIGDIDIIVASPEPETVMTAFCTLPEVTRVLGRGPTKSSIILASGVQVDLRVVEEGQFWSAILYFTGSKDHNIALRRRALERGWSLSEYGVKEESTGRNLAGSTEEDLYRMLDLPYIEPELRENQGEIEAAENGSLPKVVQYNAAKGDLHVHSDWVDGRGSIRDLAVTARKRGYEYIAVCDHSRSPMFNRGLTEENIVRQQGEIRQLNRELEGISLLHGIECGIDENGKPDLPSRVLKDFDLVIAGVHDGLRMHGDEMTTRIISALHNENIDIIGHPTGRILLQREPAELDLPMIFGAARESQVVLEINGNPARLDLSDINCRKAKEFGVSFSLCSDANGTTDLQQIELSTGTARRGWLTAEEIINTRPLAGVRTWLLR